MIGLSQAQGVVLAVGGLIFIAIALGVLLVRGRHKATVSATPDIPRGMRPGPSDADLETPLLVKLQGWGVILFLFLLVWVPVTWLMEPSRNLNQEDALTTDAINRGSHAVQMFSEDNQSGVGCVRCHGPELKGSVILNTKTGTPIPTPNLTTVCGGPFNGHALIYSLNDIYTTIEQGRNLMPSWSIKYAGALNDQQINDIVNYVVSIQDESQVPFEHNVCLNPDAQTAAVEQFLGGDLSKKPSPTTNVVL
jgi:mono/diheme cytochrome c family protein